MFKWCFLLNLVYMVPVFDRSKCRRIVEAIVVDDKGKVLLLKRSKNNSRFVGKWQLPGGKIEKKETPLRAIKREIMEEISCSCHKLKLVKKVSFSSFYSGSKSSAELLVFSCFIRGDVLISLDHSKYRFFSMRSIKKSSLTPASRVALFNGLFG